MSRIRAMLRFKVRCEILDDAYSSHGYTLPERSFLRAERIRHRILRTTRITGLLGPTTRAPALEIHSSNGTLSFTHDWYDAWGKVDLYRVGQAMEEVGPSGRPDGADGHLIGAGPAHFVACLKGEEQPILTAAHALHVLDIMLAATRSASEGCAVEVGTGGEWTTT